MNQNRRSFTDFGESFSEFSLKISIRQLCNERSLQEVYDKLKALPSDAAVDIDLPTGNFWIIGPAPNGLCYVYQKIGYVEERVSLHKVDQLTEAGFIPLLAVVKASRR